MFVGRKLCVLSCYKEKLVLCLVFTVKRKERLSHKRLEVGLFLVRSCIDRPLHIFCPSSSRTDVVCIYHNRR